MKCKAAYLDKCLGNYDCEPILKLLCNPNNKKCVCDSDKEFDFQQKLCADPDNNGSTTTAMQIYKITMIFASSCLALILVVFLFCILRKSYCPPQRHLVPMDNNTIPDIYTLFPHVGNYDGGPLGDGTQPPFEKPPTYDETLTFIRNEIGIPPPAYSPNSTNPSTPDMSSRVVITRPQLMTVSDEQNSFGHSSCGTSSSSQISIAGPSGHCRGNNERGMDRGIDNLAFHSL